MAKCKSCGAPIRWVTMKATGRRMPVEVENTTIVGQGSGGGFIVKGNIPHWANCPGADNHREPKVKNLEPAPISTRESG